MGSDESTASPDVDYRALAVALIDITNDVRRKSLEGTGVPPLSNGMIEILRVVERNPGITVHETAHRLGRQFSNVSTQLRELVALGLVTRIRDAADKRYVTLHPTEEALRIKTLLETAWSGTVAASMAQLHPGEQAAIQASLAALQRLASVIGRPD